MVVAGIGVAAAALAAQMGLKKFNEYQASKPKAEESAASVGTEAGAGATGAASGGSATNAAPGGTATNEASSWFDNITGKRFYDGGFEEKMTRREAALILGVRESATPQRIKDQHRRILMLNHPDKGGSKYMATKINAAKEMLLQGRKK